jgi:putative hemolysin
VVAAITYLTLILGELVPKQIALANAERVAALVARPMQLLSLAFTPLVVMLDVSSRVVLRLMGRSAEHRQKVTDEEIRMLLAEAAETGVVEHAERDMIGGVMRLADRRIEALMTPRVDMVWLDIDTAEAELRERLRDRPHSRFVVSHGELDEVLGLVQGRDLLAQLLDGRPLDVRAALRQPVFVHEGTGALAALEQLRRAPIPVAIVVDEYGGVLGLVTAIDILAAIAGELAETQEAGEPAAMRREDGSWLLDGGLPIDELRELLELRGEAEAPGFHTLAGLVLQELGHVPHSGEHFELEDYRFEVMDMDGHRVDKVLVTPKAVPEPPA